MSRVGQVWEYNIKGKRIDVYLIVADNDDGSYKMADLQTGEFFQRVQLPDELMNTCWRWVM